MVATYKPGTVAVVCPINAKSTTRAIRHRNGGWVTTDFGYFPDGEVCDIRPLVVLDMEHVVSHLSDTTAGSIDWLCRELKRQGQAQEKIADAIKEQYVRPRIPEPGKYGVVVAHVHGDIMRQEWVSEGVFWRALDSGHSAEWTDFINPVLIREGVS